MTDNHQWSGYVELLIHAEPYSGHQTTLRYSHSHCSCFSVRGMFWMHSLHLSKAGTCVSDAGTNQHELMRHNTCHSYKEQSNDACYQECAASERCWALLQLSPIHAS